MTQQTNPGSVALFQFPVFDVDGITLVSGLLDAAFTKFLAKDAAVDATPITVTEISGGIYAASFTPATDGLWFAQITTPNDCAFGERWEVGAFPADSIAAIAAGVWGLDPRVGAFPAAGRMLDRLRVYLTNRNKLDFAAQEAQVFEDDGTTVAQRWDVKTASGPPQLVTDQFGSPTERLAPKDPL